VTKGDNNLNQSIRELQLLLEAAATFPIPKDAYAKVKHLMAQRLEQVSNFIASVSSLTETDSDNEFEALAAELYEYYKYSHSSAALVKVLELLK